MDNTKIDKYLGALLGAAIGDAFGWPNEQNSNRVKNDIIQKKEVFQTWSRRSGGRFWLHEEQINAGEYSDDTQLIIATARSLCYGDEWGKHFSKVEIPAWLSYERGGGGATKRSAEIWKKGYKPWKVEGKNLNQVKKYFEAGGNGVAMRILPHVFGNEENDDKIMRQVVLNGIFTHGHPRALIGATLYADALIYISKNSEMLGYGELIEYLLSRRDKWGKFPEINNIHEWIANADTVISRKPYTNLWTQVADEVVELLMIAKNGLERGALDIGNSVLNDLGCFDKNTNGAGTVTAVASIYMFSKYASNPELGIIEASYLEKADTDTLASMVGGLLGMLHGIEWIMPEWYTIQDYELFRRLIKDMIKYDLNNPKLRNANTILDSSKQSLKDILKTCDIGNKLYASPFNELVVQEKIENKVKMNGITVKTVKLVSEEGQSIFIKTFERVNSSRENKYDDANSKEVALRKEDEKLNNTSIEKTIFEEQQNELVLTTKKREILINANRLRSFANVLPESMPIDQYLFLISDIMLELERENTMNIDEKTTNTLKKRWSQFNITDKQIFKIIEILMNY